MKITIICALCLKEFETNRKDKLFCTRKHMKLWNSLYRYKWIKPLIIKCKQCGKEVRAFRSQLRKFCNHKCYSLYHRQHKEEWDTSYFTPEFRQTMSDKAKKQWEDMTEEEFEKILNKRFYRTRVLHKWSLDYDECIGCGRNDFKYMGKGMCANCYQKKYKRDYWIKVNDRYLENGIFYGKKGVISYADMDERLQCHICGEYYKHLGCHIVEGHKFELDWYREQFEIKQTFGLVNDEIKKILSDTIKKTLANHVPDEVLEARKTIGERSLQYNRRHSWRLQSIIPLLNNPPNWFKYATKEEIKNWAEKMLQGGSKIVDSKCAVCGIKIVASNWHKNHTYCNNCRRLSYNKSHLKYMHKRLNKI